MAILFGFEARCLFSVVFLLKAKQGRLLVAVSNHKSLSHQRTGPRTDSAWKRQIVKARWVSYISSPHHGYCDVGFLLWRCEKFFRKFVVLGNLTCAQEPRWLRVALSVEREHFIYVQPIGHFPVSKNLTFKTSLSAKPLLSYCIIIKHHFHINGFALSLALKQRLQATRK